MAEVRTARFRVQYRRHSQSARETLVDADEEIWDRIIAVNLKGVFLCMKYEGSPMARQGNGAIVNMASLAGILAEPGCYAYVASKHGIMGLTKTAAFDLTQGPASA